jgi:alginate O-acetyltransferase complex protein AlgI
MRIQAMLFNSWGYFLFLLLAVPMHWVLPHGRARVGFLAACSVLFYSMWRWEFSLLVVLSALVDFIASQRIAKSEETAVRRRWLALSLTINLGLLIAFKYTYFIHDNIQLVAGALGAEVPGPDDLGLRIILPLGISFYTFQTISYTIDVYRRTIVPTERFLSFLAYVTFWPQLIAGPVLRASEVIPQLEAPRKATSEDLAKGSAMIIAGLFKKTVIADGLAPFVDEIFALDPTSLTALDTWVGSFLFGFQIYFDFAGYSTVAIGSALLVGLHFPANFNWPYVSRSPREFWKRWHISLSAWIRDYLYLPLTGQPFLTRSEGGISVAAGKAQAGGRNVRALLLTWFIMGLWHGASWNFALWGLYHAVLILLYRRVGLLRALPERSPLVAWLVMLFLSMAGWISFRAVDLHQALVLFGTLVDPTAYTLAGRAASMYAYFWAGVMTVAMGSAYLCVRHEVWRRIPSPALAVVQIGALALMVGGILVSMRAMKQFIYFQF